MALIAKLTLPIIPNTILYYSCCCLFFLATESKSNIDLKMNGINENYTPIELLSTIYSTYIDFIIKWHSLNEDSFNGKFQ